MAYDEELAHRIRALLGDEAQVREQKMFGGLAFLVNGAMTIAASGQGGILVRVDPEKADRLLHTTPAEQAVMRGRPMRGWLRVAAEHLSTKAQLRRWVQLSLAHAGTLPARSVTAAAVSTRGTTKIRRRPPVSPPGGSPRAAR